jgi:hypothetical protein
VGEPPAGGATSEPRRQLRAASSALNGRSCGHIGEATARIMGFNVPQASRTVVPGLVVGVRRALRALRVCARARGRRAAAPLRRAVAAGSGWARLMSSSKQQAHSCCAARRPCHPTPAPALPAILLADRTVRATASVPGALPPVCECRHAKRARCRPASAEPPTHSVSPAAGRCGRRRGFWG